MAQYLNARCKQILQLLLNQQAFLPLTALGRTMDVSRRTLYYDLEKINDWLREGGLPELEQLRDKGVFLSQASRERVNHLLCNRGDSQIYLFSPEERVQGIICYIIYRPEKIQLEQLMECFDVSRNTIFTDLKDVNRRLEQYHLKLEYQNKQGYFITGDPVHIRALFGMLFLELHSLFASNRIPFFAFEAIQPYLKKLEDIQQALGRDYVEGTLTSLAATMPIAYREDAPITVSGLREDKVRSSKEYGLLSQKFPDLPDSELLYFALRLLGARVNVIPDKYFQQESEPFVTDLARTLISEFEKIACIVFEDRKALEKALVGHLQTSLYRFRYGIQMNMLLTSDVRSQYPELFAITKLVAKRLEEELEVPISDSEIAYLAMHFGGALRISRNDRNELRILIVCVNGISTGNMLRREVQKLLPFAKIVGVVSSRSMVNPQDVCDLMIATVTISSVVPVITVHPVLTDFDKRNILNHRLIAPKNVEIQRDRLFQVVKKYVDPSRHEQLLQDLTTFLQDGERPELPGKEKEYGLLQVLDESRIQFLEGSCSWKKSLQAAGAILSDYRSIDPSYVETIIHQLQLYGPYMFLREDVILAHAKPEDGVNRLDLSLVICPEPIVFSELRRAKLIFLLAAEDQEKHLGLLQDIFTVLSQKGAVESLHAAKSSPEVLEILAGLLAQDSPE